MCVRACLRRTCRLVGGGRAYYTVSCSIEWRAGEGEGGGRFCVRVRVRVRVRMYACGAGPYEMKKRVVLRRRIK